MPKRIDISKIILLGSGPSIIGQASEYDYAGAMACRTMRELGYSVVYVNSNPASITTDPELADKTYIEPLTLDSVTDIIAREKPDALLSSMGGQPGLILSYKLQRSGILEKHGVQLIGVTANTIEQCENRNWFRTTMSKLGIETPEGRSVENLNEAESTADDLGYPLVIRPYFTLGGKGGDIVYNVEDLRGAVLRGLSFSPVNQILVEKSMMGWQELEMEVIRDRKKQTICAGFIENIDPAGVHTGDSLCVSPMQTVNPDIKNRLRELGSRISDGIDLVGSANIQFAYDPQADRVKVIEINARTSRSSMLVSKSTGLPIPKIAALLAVGHSLDEIPFLADQALEHFSPPENGIAVKWPRWEFEKYEGVSNQTGPQMRSVGQVMAAGATFKEALSKAVQSLEIDRHGLGFIKNYNDLSRESLISRLVTSSSDRYFLIYEALRTGIDIQTITSITHIKPWFITHLKEMVELEERLRQGGKEGPTREDLEQAKIFGFSDHYLKILLNRTEMEILETRHAMGIRPGFIPLPSCQDDMNPGYYSTYSPGPDSVRKHESEKKIMVLGNGPNRIGQGGEYDYCCFHALKAIRDAGYGSIMVNSNPDAVSTDPEMADRLYVEPMTVEKIKEICELEKPFGVILQFGGETPFKMSHDLRQAGVNVLDISPETIQTSQDRVRFNQIMRELGIPQPESLAAETREQALELAERLGFPLILRSRDFTPEGSKRVVRDRQMFMEVLDTLEEIDALRPVLMDQYLDNAIEAEVDAVTDGTDVFIPAVIEFIELSGIHPADSACVIPPVSIPPKHIETMGEYTQKIAAKLGMTGLINIQFAIFNNTVYVLEATPGVSRTIPLVSKVCNMPMIQLATQMILGRKLSELDIRKKTVSHYGIKEAVFPFNIFHEIDPVLGLDARSTGQVLGLSDTYGRSFYKAQEASHAVLPLEGSVLFTIADRDKSAALEPVRLFRDLGFQIMTTSGTHQFLKEKGIDTIRVKKLGYGRPDLVDMMKIGEIHLFVNTPSEKRSSQDNSAIRKAAIKYNIPYMTTTAAAIAAAKGIKERRKGKHRVKSLQEYYREMG